MSAVQCCLRSTFGLQHFRISRTVAVVQLGAVLKQRPLVKPCIGSAHFTTRAVVTSHGPFAISMHPPLASIAKKSHPLSLATVVRAGTTGTRAEICDASFCGGSCRSHRSQSNCAQGALPQEDGAPFQEPEDLPWKNETDPGTTAVVLKELKGVHKAIRAFHVERRRTLLWKTLAALLSIVLGGISYEYGIWFIWDVFRCFLYKQWQSFTERLMSVWNFAFSVPSLIWSAAHSTIEFARSNLNSLVNPLKCWKYENDVKRAVHFLLLAEQKLCTIKEKMALLTEMHIAEATLLEREMNIVEDEKRSCEQRVETALAELWKLDPSQAAELRLCAHKERLMLLEDLLTKSRGLRTAMRSDYERQLGEAKARMDALARDNQELIYKQQAQQSAGEGDSTASDMLLASLTVIVIMAQVSISRQCFRQVALHVRTWQRRRARTAHLHARLQLSQITEERNRAKVAAASYQRSLLEEREKGMRVAQSHQKVEAELANKALQLKRAIESHQKGRAELANKALQLKRAIEERNHAEDAAACHQRSLSQEREKFARALQSHQKAETELANERDALRRTCQEAKETVTNQASQLLTMQSKLEQAKDELNEAREEKAQVAKQLETLHHERAKAEKQAATDEPSSMEKIMIYSLLLLLLNEMDLIKPIGAIVVAIWEKASFG